MLFDVVSLNFGVWFFFEVIIVLCKRYGILLFVDGV